jgi:hypothetical protein
MKGGRGCPAVEKEIGLPHHLLALAKSPEKVVIGRPLVLVQKKSLRCGVAVGRIGKTMKEAVMMAQPALYIGCDDPGVAVADTMDPAHNKQSPACWDGVGKSTSEDFPSASKRMCCKTGHQLKYRSTMGLD